MIPVTYFAYHTISEYDRMQKQKKIKEMQDDAPSFLINLATIISATFHKVVNKLTQKIKNLKFYSFSEKTKQIFKGNQHGCDGRVEKNTVEIFRQKIAALAPDGIKFNPKKVQPFINGGACSAMSLKFLETYFEAKRSSENEFNEMEPQKCVDFLIKHKHEFASCSQELRHRQAAYNTIEVNTNGKELDYSRSKIEALAHDRSLKIDHASSEQDLCTMKDSSELLRELEQLPDGAFLIRMIKPAQNEKLEEYGHSLVYVKEKGMSLFYDPNYGLKDLSCADQSKALFDGLKSCFHSFGVSKTRFYRMTPLE